ncbi:hypothetical protein [Motilimonas cestriensis]|uniref:hypothetical protein n=1 Tax=Motilimonas cestriensis TaxID=2742685 RepID=UPI003DA55FB5
MPLPVTVYRWDDAGAPSAANSKPSEIINVLKKCLVEGYGDKQPLGWSVAFEDAAALKIAFKNNEADGGSGGHVQFWSKSDDASTQKMLYQGAATMPALDEFFMPGYRRAFVGPSGGNAEWALIGCGRAFYFFIGRPNMDMSSGTYYNFSMFVGDLDGARVVGQDPACFVAFDGSANDSESTSYTNTFDYCVNNVQQCVKIYALDGSNYSENHWLFLPWSTPSGSREGEIAGAVFSPIPITLFDRPVKIDNRFDAAQFPPLRGFMPGLFQANQAGYSLSPWPTVREFGGHSYWLFRTSSHDSASSWLDLGGWYE